MRRIRLGWRDLAEGLGVRYLNCPSDEDVLRAARERARAWADCFEAAVHEPLAPEEREAIAAEAEDSARCHWSAEAVLPALLDVPPLVEAVNALCRCDPPSGRPFARGDGLLSWSEGGDGVRFAVASPIVLGYEAARLDAGLADDGVQLRDIGAPELIFVIRRACGPVELDLGGWEHEMDDPAPDAVARFVSRRRSRLSRVSGQIGAPGAQSPAERNAR
jgi:hypothetical protein